MPHPIKYLKNLIKNQSHLRLVTQSQQGNKYAFASLYQTYRNPIYRYLFFRTNQDQSTAEDLTQITFTKAWEKLDKFSSSKGTFQAWLYRIPHTLLIDPYRHSSTHTSQDLNPNIPDHQPTPEQQLDHKTTRQNLYQAINQLKPSQQQLIILHHIEGLSYQEIAHITHKHPDALRAINHRALKRLKQLISQHEN